MATGVVFGRPSSRIFQPGAYSQVDASNLNITQAFARNIICFIGAAIGGKPMHLYKFNDPAAARAVFGAGSPLADAISFGFSGGVNGGAPLIYGIRADNAAQASGTLTAPNGTQIRGIFKDWGGYGNTFAVSFLPGSVAGTMALVTGTTVDGLPYEQRIDNETSFSNLIDRLNDESPITIEVLQGGVRANQDLLLATSTDDGKAQINDEAGTLITNAAYLYQYPASLIANTTDSFTAAFDATVSWAVSAVDTTANTFTATGSNLADDTPIALYGNTLPPEIEEGRTYYVVSGATNTFQAAATVGGAAIDITGSVASAKVVRAFGDTTITSSIPAAAEGTYSVAAVRDAYTQSVTSAGITATAYGSNIYRITLAGADEWGYADDEGLIGSIFEIASGNYAGTYQVLHYEFDGFSGDIIRTVMKLTSGEIEPGTYTGNLEFWPLLQMPRSQPATEALETQLPANGVLYRGGHYITVTLEIPDDAVTLSTYYSTEPGDTIESVGQVIAQQINESVEWQNYAIASAVYNGGTYTSTITLTAKAPGTLQNNYRPNILVNVNTTVLATVGGVQFSGGVDPDPPRDAQGNISGSCIMAGGYDSVPTFQRWLDALEVIKYEPLRYLVPVNTDNIGVQAAFANHCKLMASTPQRRERMAIMGHGLGWTKQQIRARAEFFNSERVVFVSPGLEMPDTLTGNLRMYSSAYAATGIIAGMLAAEGNAVSDPITHTFLSNVTRTEFAYQPGSLELDDAIKSGVLTIEKDPTLVRESRGFRVTRGITTARFSPVFESISVINQSDFIAQVIRDMEETLFIGQAILPTTLELVKTYINLELRRYTDEKIIYGFDPNYTRTSLNRDNRSAIDAAYKFYPAPALEFILNTQLLFPIPETEAVA